MDFALRQMKAMGWTEGKGLGLSENGITTSVKPNTQKDTRGLGFTIEDSIQLKNQWWSEAYNAARKGLKSELKITSVGVVVKVKKQTDETEDQTGSACKAVYNDRFVSAGLLESKNTENQDDDEDEPKDGEEQGYKSEKKKKNKRKNKIAVENSVEEDTVSPKNPTSIDFNKVFKEAKGMTCHKAARLGIKMDGKMKRIQDQEEEFLKKFKR